MTDVINLDQIRTIPDMTIADPGDHEELQTSQAGNWTRIPLHDPQYLIPPDPPTIKGLLYQARRHVFSGAPESAKTLIAYHLLLEALRDNNPVTIIDFEMGAVAARRLLHELGATTDEIARIFYVEPDQPPAPEDIQAVLEHGTRYALIDAAIGAYDATGLDDSSRKDAETFARLWVKPLWKADVATLLLDHVTKNADTRGKYAIGSERKAGQTDVHLGFEALKPLSRGGTGMVKVTVHKDRPGFLQRPTAVVLDLASHPTTHELTITLRDPHPVDEEGTFRPTIYMERVSRALEKQGESMTRNEIEDAVKGKRDYVREAIDWLITDGHATEKPGPRNARIITLQKPYTKPKDDLAPTSPPPRPGEVPVTSPDFAPPRPPLTGGEGEDGGHGKATSNNDLAPDTDDPETRRLIELYGHPDNPPAEPQ